MAKQSGIIKLKGTIGGVTFYRSQDGHLAREKGGVDGDRIAKDDAFIRTRENGSEFGASASAGKLLRDALRSMLMTASDNRVTARLTKVMSDIKNLDTINVRGERTVGTAIMDPAAKALLDGFDFNIKAILGSILFKPYSVNTATGEISINSLVPLNDIRFPSGSTHINLKGAWAKVDFAAGTYDVQQSSSVNLAVNGTSTNVLLSPAAVPSGSGTDLFLLQIEFFQEVNGLQYSMKNGSYNALNIVDIL
jgi:hypothetical protein